MYKEKNKPSTEEDLYPHHLAKEVNKSLEYYIKEYQNTPDILRKAISYTVLSGGKRFRPILCLLIAQSLGKDYEIVMPTACAIEFIHTYSLIHDDLPAIDNDKFRRGKLTCHRKFGEDIAILTGDALYAEAIRIILEKQKCDAEIKIKILNEITSATGASGMVAGQIMDVHLSGNRVSTKKLEEIHYNKTGKLIIASVRCGAILGGASKEYLDNLTYFAKNIGIVFQITDDILDVTSTSKQLGKETGKDTILEKNTYPGRWGIEKSKRIAQEKIEKAIKMLNSMDIDSYWLVNIANFLLIREK